MPRIDELQRQRPVGTRAGYRAGRALRRLGVILSLGCLFLVGALCPPFVFAQATLENPAPDSFQSGIGIISGWACAARSIEIVFNDGPPQQAAYGTSRGDTHTACGDTDNGFGLLFNWNLLGDGEHTVQALADGVKFASVTVTVTTFGTEFLREASGTVLLTDFPTPGSTLALRWQPAQQNFALTDGSAGRGSGTSGTPPHVLENPVPGSFQSGLGVISGWACEAQRIDITFDDGPPHEAAYGTSRGDTAPACGDADNGFSLLFNWNLLGDGLHTVAASADGVEFARVEVTVTTLGREIQRGLRHEVTVPDFPAVGTETVLQWSEAQQNFVITQTTYTPVAVDIHHDNVIVLHLPELPAIEEAINLVSYTRRIYKEFEDAFDYLMFVFNLDEKPEGFPYGVYSPVRNDTQGIGRGTFFQPGYGSQEHLRGVVYFPYRDAIRRGPSLHELLHTWANFVVSTTHGAHWGFSSADGQLGGFPLRDLVHLGGDRYTVQSDFGTVANFGNSVPYSPIELYLAGLIPPDEVPDLWVAEDGEWLVENGERVLSDEGWPIFTATTIRTIIIDDIIAEHGERVPDWTVSQKDFQAAAVLLVDAAHPATPAQIQEVSDHVAWFSHPGNDDDSSLYNFYEATGGRAFITMDGLSQFLKDG